MGACKEVVRDDGLCYPSASAAGAVMGVTPSAIRVACRDGTSCCGHLWSYAPSDAVEVERAAARARGGQSRKRRVKAIKAERVDSYLPRRPYSEERMRPWEL